MIGHCHQAVARVRHADDVGEKVALVIERDPAYQPRPLHVEHRRVVPEESVEDGVPAPEERRVSHHAAGGRAARQNQLPRVPRLGTGRGEDVGVAGEPVGVYKHHLADLRAVRDLRDVRVCAVQLAHVDRSRRPRVAL